MKLRLVIDGRTAEVPSGLTVLAALRQAGVDVPALCADERLPAASACRVCQVFVDGRERPVCACAEPVRDGMSVRTDTPELDEYRRTMLGLLAAHYPPEAVKAFPERPFHRWLERYGVEAGTELGLDDEAAHTRPAPDTAHPYIHVDMSRCIHCYRCVHVCESVQGQFVWKITNRGDHTAVVPDSGTTLLASSCVSCGACVEACPSGALEDAARVQQGAPTSWTRTTCPYCGTGCELNVGVKDDLVVVSRPAPDAPVNKGHLCVKGRYGSGFIDAPDRVTSPMVRRNGQWVRVSWDEALDAAAEALRTARSLHGADSVGVLGSSRATNEESYLAAKFSRVVMGTNNVDCCARVCHGPSAAGLGLVFGTGAATNSFDDIERAHAFLVVGANPTENHPIVGARIRQRVLAGVPLVVVDPRRTELAAIATVHLQIRPGTNLPLLNALARIILSEGLADGDFVAARTAGFDAFVHSLEEWTPDRAADVCGVSADDLRRAARIYATARPAMAFNGLGLTEHIQGTDGVAGLANLAMLTGNVGRVGGGVNPLRGQNNVQGTANMGCEPSRLTGYQKLDVARELHEKVWGVPVPVNPGLTLMTLLDAAAEGRVKSLLAIGYDVLLSNPNAHGTREAMRRLDSLIVVDLFMTETAREFGTVFLPAQSSFEKDGTFMNGERRIQRVRRAITPRGEARSDWEIVCQLAARLGAAHHFAFPDVESIWNEVRAVWPAVKGITYARLEERGLQWPCPSEDHPGTEVLHATTFPVGPRATFRPLEYRASGEQRSDAFPLILNTGRTLMHFNAATMTGRTRNRELRADDLVQIHPDDAAALGLTEGARITVKSRHGEFPGRVTITDVVRKGELFTTFHNVAAFVNNATGTGRDAITHTPEYKVTAVRVRPG